MCSTAAKLGVRTLGIDKDLEVNLVPHQGFQLICQDILDGPVRRADLVLCLEVAEHMPESSADRLVQRLADCTDGKLLFSAATPGQGGSGHINEQPHKYWMDKIKAAGLVLSTMQTRELRILWSTVAPDAWWYGQNVMVWRRA
jgi:hypothetical protein